MAGTALARQPSTAVAGFLDFDEAKRHAVVLARSGLVPDSLKDNPDGVMLVGLLGQELGVPFVASLKQIHIIENSPSPSAQLQLALIHRAGHKARFIESTRERAVMRGRHRDDDPADPKSWVEVEWTEEDAREARLLDEWVERWQKAASGKNYKEKVLLRRQGDGYVPAEFGATALPEWAQKEIAYGKVKRKDNWWSYRRDMLRARCASAFCRMVCPEVLLGMDLYTAEERGVDVGQDVDEPTHTAGPEPDDEIFDAELVEQPTAGDTHPDGAEQGPASAGGGENGGGTVVEPSAAPAPEPSRPSPYARAIHIAAAQAGLDKAATAAAIESVTGDPSANSVTRENREAVMEAIQAAAGSGAAAGEGEPESEYAPDDDGRPFE